MKRSTNLLSSLMTVSTKVIQICSAYVQKSVAMIRKWKIKVMKHREYRASFIGCAHHKSFYFYHNFNGKRFFWLICFQRSFYCLFGYSTRHEKIFISHFEGKIWTWWTENEEENLKRKKGRRPITQFYLITSNRWNPLRQQLHKCITFNGSIVREKKHSSAFWNCNFH